MAGFRTSFAAALVGLIGIVTLYFTAATYRQNRAKDQSQFELAQAQLRAFARSPRLLVVVPYVEAEWVRWAAVGLGASVVTTLSRVV